MMFAPHIDLPHLPGWIVILQRRAKRPASCNSVPRPSAIRRWMSPTSLNKQKNKQLHPLREPSTTQLIRARSSSTVVEPFCSTHRM